MSAPPPPSSPPWSIPWLVPTPLRPSDFVPLFERHAHLNVETALADIGAFDLQGAPCDLEALLYSDVYQPVEGANLAPGGSARSGFHRGKYLKGVGRTLLAVHWPWTGQDPYHTSGHLFPTGAVRELLMSAAARSAGVEDCIVACEGLLLKPLAGEDAAGLAESYREKGVRLPPIDLSLQAISVKGGSFVRLANLAWLLNQVGIDDTGLNRRWMFELVRRLNGAFGSDVTGYNTDLDTGAVLRCIEAGVERMMRCHEAGIAWGSWHNNYAVDGRFLDLETGFWLGRPFFGFLRFGAGAGAPPGRVETRDLRAAFGLGALHYTRSLRMFFTRLRARFRILADTWGAADPEIARMIRGGHRAAGRVLRRLRDDFSDVSVCARSFDIQVRHGTLTRKGRDRLLRAVESAVRRTAGLAPVQLAFEPAAVTLDLADIELGMRPAIVHPRWLDAPELDARAARFNAALRELDAMRDLRGVLRALRAWTGDDGPPPSG